MNLILAIGRGLLGIIYSFMKLGPIKNRAVFISRQGNKPSQDLTMLSKELEKNSIETVILCKKLEKNIKSLISYPFHMLVQMKYMATSKVVILDSYCIAACLLNHREETKIIQMWHALGSMKKFGYSIIDQPEGRSSKIAKAMRMHQNYDYVFASSSFCSPFFAEAFGYTMEHMRVMPLPRVDAVRSRELEELAVDRILKEYPDIKSKKLILYAPTLRRGRDMAPAIKALVNAFDYEKYNLVIKLHPVAAEGFQSDKALVDKKYPSIDWFALADVVITDYSALTYEVAIKGKPLIFYAFDHDDYIDRRDFYIDYDKEMPGPITASPNEIVRAIEEDNFDIERIRNFADKYIEKRDNCTKEIADFIKRLV